MTAVARVEKKLRNGRLWCTPAFRFEETSPEEVPHWERASPAEAGLE